MEGEEGEEGAKVEVIRRGGKRVDGAVRVTIQDDLTDSQQSPGKDCHGNAGNLFCL